MRVLLDENIDRLLKPLFSRDFEVVTVRERGWQGRSNGELLKAAEKEFDAFITMDTNLEYQQDLRQFRLAVVVLHASSNAYSIVSPLMPKVNEILRSISPGGIERVRA